MLDFIINPKAGGKKEKFFTKILLKLEALLIERQVDYALHKTNSAKQATFLTKTLIESGATDIIVVGGDGTLHEVINGFSNFEKVNLGIIPCGTGNDFATALKIPLDPVEALKIILDGTPKFTDFMQMPSVRGLNIIGTGIDVDVLRRYSLKKKKTKWSYTSCLIKTLFNFDYIDFDAEFNNKKENYRSFIACIANGYRYGGGIPICPPADPTDKKLDFLIVREIKPRLKIIPTFLKLKMGKILNVKQTEHSRVESIKITPSLPYTVNVDGELYENIPFEVKIVSDKLKVYRP